MAFYPRKRAQSIVPRVRTWPDVELGRPVLLGFIAYKAGMAHAIVVDDRPTSPLYGKELAKAVTILDAPPIVPFAVRLYGLDPRNGYRVTLGEAWAPKLPAGIERVVPTLPKQYDFDAAVKRLEEQLPLAVDVRVIVATQPRLSGIGKKTPELIEIPIGGTPSIEEKFRYALSILGKEINIGDVFAPGQFVDVVAITKGKGTEGVIKRFGVTIKPRWHKHRKRVRWTGTVGPQAPGPMFTIPRGGQMGFQQRTEYNKRLIAIGANGAEITPKSGFKHYGVIKGPYAVLLGSVPGPPKRPIVLRHPVRPPKFRPTGPPQVLAYVFYGSEIRQVA